MKVTPLTLREHAHMEHSSLDWWMFDAWATASNTCPTCLNLNQQIFRGDEIPDAFPYHTHDLPNRIRARVHPHCRCVLRWVGRDKRGESHERPTSLLKHITKQIEPVQIKINNKNTVTPLHMSPSQRRLFQRTNKFARETFRRKKR